jgi:hydrogenase maturation protein HypF
MRRARGYAPLPVHLKQPLPTVLAVGAHLKNNVALSIGQNVFISQHIGDLSTATAYAAFRRTADDLPRLYDVHPEVIACDLHPEYLSTKFARELAAPFTPVQHHYAHVLACLAENEVEIPALGVSWDGTGFGLDGTIWGGEFLRVNDAGFDRVAHLHPFRLPGGDVAAREPRRSALGALYEIFGADLFLFRNGSQGQNFTDGEWQLLRQMFVRGAHAPVTTSAGRLFDAVASIIGLRQRSNFEGQAAMELEFALAPGVNESYPFALTDSDPAVVDWRPMLRAVLAEILDGEEPGTISARFHNTLAKMIATVAERFGEHTVALTGGCFQNRQLTERTVAALTAAGFHPIFPQRVPANDGGIALGQILAAAKLVPAVKQHEEEVAA